MLGLHCTNQIHDEALLINLVEAGQAEVLIRERVLIENLNMFRKDLAELLRNHAAHCNIGNAAYPSPRIGVRVGLHLDPLDALQEIVCVNISNRCV